MPSENFFHYTRFVRAGKINLKNFWRRLYRAVENLSAKFYNRQKFKEWFKGYVSDADGISTLATEIEIDGEKKDVRISVGNEYGKFLSPERADYALIGMLAYALRNKHDIICEAPVTEELLFNINEFLIPTLIRNDKRNYPVKIQADIAQPLDKLSFAKSKVGRNGNGHVLRRRQFLFRS